MWDNVATTTEGIGQPVAASMTQNTIHKVNADSATKAICKADITSMCVKHHNKTEYSPGNT